MSNDAGALTNPYHIASGICLESLRGFLAEKKQGQLQPRNVSATAINQASFNQAHAHEP